MATVTPVTTFPFESSEDVALTTWTDLAADDDGEAVCLAIYSDRSVQITGTFGGASVTFAGSNDGVNYFALHDTAGDSLALTVAALKQIVELPLYIKPRVFGGDGTTAVTITLAGRKSIR